MGTFATFLLLGLVATAAQATTFVGMTERALARAADAIVVGTVEDIESVATPDGGISTLVTVAVEREHKGHVGAWVTLRQPGGRVGDRLVWIAGSPRFVRGDRQLLFLSAHRDGTARVTAFGLGQFTLRPHARSGVLMAERRLDGAVLGPRPLRRAPLARLVRTIERAVAADRAEGRAIAPLLTAPPELAAPGLERETLARFTLMDEPPGRWFEADAGEPVVYDVAGHDAALGTVASLAAVDAALGAWSQVSGTRLLLGRGGDGAAVPLACDGVSQIVFDDPYNEMPSPVRCSGVLALGGYCAAGRTGVVNGRRFVHITEGNITFNRGFGGCRFWTETNLAEVATHEIGHTIGIGHSAEADDAPPTLKDATMYYRAHFDGRGASVHADDIAAVRFVYPGDSAADPASEDSDGDGWTDVGDNCPAIPNTVQTDTDADGAGDLCDLCPLVAGDAASCQPIQVSRLEITRRRRHARLLWRGSIELPPGAGAAAARAVLVSAAGVVVDTQVHASLRRRPGLPPRLRYRAPGALITLRPRRSGGYAVRLAVRHVDLTAAPLPLVSASLQVGPMTYAAALGCERPRGRRIRCRG